VTGVRTLLTGLAVGESPRWHEGRLWLANWGTGEIIALAPDGPAEVVVRVPPDLPSSIDWLPDGRLLAVSGHQAQLLRREPDGTLVTHADLRPFGRVFNEVVVDIAGNAYVNGGDFDLMAGEQFVPGIIVRVAPDGQVRQVADGIAFGNGMAITPDGRTLIVAESYAHRLSAFAISCDGGLTDRRIWADLGDGYPDGICLDVDGAVWYADVPNRRCVRVQEGGAVLQTVAVDRGAFACMLGGADGRTLFVLAAQWHGPDAMAGAVPSGVVYAVQVGVPRAGRP
jgi:sugar lactone lactonase YvrE